MPCSSVNGYEGYYQHLKEKLANAEGRPEGGADLYQGASAAIIYVNCKQDSTVPTHEPVGGTVKVAIHELIHIHQVQALSGTMTSITPPTDTLGDSRFQVKNYHSACPTLYEQAIKGVLDAMPASMKLLTVPTYVLIVPETTGIGSSSQVKAAADELVSLMFPNDCAGVTFESTWWYKENGQIAEGEAEYYAANVLLAPGANAYNDANTQWDGATAWAQRTNDNTGMVEEASRKQLFHIPLTYGKHNERWSDKLSCLDWHNNPVGEITYNYMKTVWRPATTQAEMQQHWITVYSAATYEAGFAVAFGQSWQQFVCDLETHYGIDRRTQTCAGVEVGPNITGVACDLDNGDGNNGGDGLSAGAIAGIVVGSMAFSGLLVWITFAYYFKLWPFRRPLRLAQRAVATAEALPMLDIKL